MCVTIGRITPLIHRLNHIWVCIRYKKYMVSFHPTTSLAWSLFRLQCTVDPEIYHTQHLKPSCSILFNLNSKVTSIIKSGGMRTYDVSVCIRIKKNIFNFNNLKKTIRMQSTTLQSWKYLFKDMFGYWRLEFGHLIFIFKRMALIPQ